MNHKLMISTLMLFSASAAAEIVTPEQHMAWAKSTFEQCSETHKLMNKRLMCEREAYMKRREAGLMRGTAEYVETQYADFSNEQISEQIKIAEKAKETAPESMHAKLGELNTTDYSFEIVAAKTMLMKRRQEQSK